MKWASALIPLLVTLSVPNCFRLSDSSIAGYVKVEGNGNPIYDAKVYLVHMGNAPDSTGNGFLSTTNREGHYWMNQIMMNGLLELIVIKEGFQEKRDTLELENGKDYEKDFTLSTDSHPDSLLLQR
jgi:hypothetical protein